ncbi:hypothetical protein [Halobacterium salinarum]|uniref:hypothetical protein n=1 Tax=Halobacterium salinarum TaxID=2242 RepID=UPI001F27715A|nr:hypothetical protein [Halobacterium salinarum]MCF2165450.1 hypothetical protein [Halobacterium salinarum]MCF2168315.1 hypothetical protein [Halobacterium salinarum]
MKNSQRRIPQQVDDSMHFFRGYSLDDVKLIAPGALICIYASYAPPAIRTQCIFVGFMVAVLGAIGIATAPEHYKSSEWASLHARHLFRQSTYKHLTYHYDHAQRTQKDSPDQATLSGLFATNERTQDVLGIKRVQSSSDRRGNTGFVQLSDDTLIGCIQIHPANLSLASSADWNKATNKLATKINTIEFPIQIYRTSKSFDTETFLQPYQDRHLNDDVQNNPILENLLTEFLNWYPQELADRGTRVTEFYVIVPVERHEVASLQRSNGVTDQLAEWPLLGQFISTGEDDTSDVVIRGRQQEELYDRLAAARGHFRELPGVEATRVDASEHAELIAGAYQRDGVDLEGQLGTTGIPTRA